VFGIANLSFRRGDREMATYNTEIQWGGRDASWHPDQPLTLTITNRVPVVPEHGAPSTGTSVTWSGAEGSGTVTFFDNGTWFLGTAQFPGEEPVGYRGTKA
jgi:FtsP/CotA-like multicopper oxidase with cupredoxin domain